MIPIDKASAKFRAVKATVFKFRSQQNHNTGTPAASGTCPPETNLPCPRSPRVSRFTSRFPWSVSSCELNNHIASGCRGSIEMTKNNWVKLTVSVAPFFNLQLASMSIWLRFLSNTFFNTQVEMTFPFFLGWKRLWAGIWQAPKVSKTRSII